MNIQDLGANCLAEILLRAAAAANLPDDWVAFTAMDADGVFTATPREVVAETAHRRAGGRT